MFSIERQIVLQQVKQSNKYNQFHFFNILNKEKRTPKENVEEEGRKKKKETARCQKYVKSMSTVLLQHVHLFERKKQFLR